MATKIHIPPHVKATVLRFGSSGEAVSLLQQALNAVLSTTPPLAADGRFGPMTNNRVKSFQNSRKLSADGVVGPLTWDALIALLQQVAQGGVAIMPAMTGSTFDALRPLVLTIAQQHMGRVDFTQFTAGKPRGLDFLIEMFDFAANVKLTEKHFKDNVGSGWNWRPLSGGSMNGGRIDWCGVFAIYCYRKAGIPVSWGVGRPQGPIRRRVPGSPAVAAPGDIGVTGSNSHHFLIETPGTTIDGNTMWGRIQRVERKTPSPVVSTYEFTH